MSGPVVTTLAIRAWRALDRPPDERCVQWAVGLLVLGTDTPAVRVLAGLTPPVEYYEATKLIDRALRELAVPILREEDAIDAYTAELLRDFMDGRQSLRDVFAELTRLCIDTDYDNALWPFYLLGHALGELDALGVQFYWEGVDRDNIDPVARQQARAWLEARPTL